MSYGILQIQWSKSDQQDPYPIIHRANMVSFFFYGRQDAEPFGLEDRNSFFPYFNGIQNDLF